MSGIRLEGIYEVHLPVRDLERSITFYTERFGLDVGPRGEDPSSALLLLEADERSMLGLWEATEAAFDPPQPRTRGHHFAFRVPTEDVDGMLAFLEDRGLEPVDTFEAQPVVHAWMPAASVYVEDPDGHLVELIAELPDDPRPELGTLPLAAWRDRDEP